jgi:hypothetical protein
MDIVPLIAVLAGIAFVIASVASRRRVAKSRRPLFLLAAICAFCAAVIMVMILSSRELFTHDFWEDPMQVILFFAFFGVMVLVGLIPAWLVVVYYRKRFENERRVA